MNGMIKIENREIQVKEYNSQRVVTFKDIDHVHERKAGTAHYNFKRNKKRFIEGEDYHKVSSGEIPLMKLEIKSNLPNGLILLTESGYLMLVKSFTDDLAWRVQREIVNNYFRVKEIVETVKMSTFPPKASSVGEIIQLGRFVRTLMKDQGATPYEIAEAVVEAIKQFGVNMPGRMLLPVRLENLEKLRDDELDMVDFAMTFPNSSYQDYLLYRVAVKTSR
jgi:hypothetical protein